MSILLLLCFLLVLYFKQSNFISLIANFPSIYLPDLWLNHGSFGQKYFLFHLCCFFWHWNDWENWKWMKAKYDKEKLSNSILLFLVYIFCASTFDVKWSMRDLMAFQIFSLFSPTVKDDFKGFFFYVIHNVTKEEIKLKWNEMNGFS
jgi:hypothetical protein